MLNNLLNSDNEDQNSIPVISFACEYEYVLHLIPNDVQHPLKDIVNCVKNPFFLVSKLPDVSTYSGDESMEDEEMVPSLKLPEISVISKQHVFVGTPISQQVSHLFWQKNFHNGETEIIETSLDIRNLLNLQLKDARYLASLYVHCIKQQNDLPEMWLLCDRRSPQNVDYLGVVPNFAEDQKLPVEVSTVMLRSQEYNDKKAVCSLIDLKRGHTIFHRVNNSEIRGYARYNIRGMLGDDVHNQDKSQSGITMEFAWDGVREILQAPPSSSSAVLNISADPDDVQENFPAITSELNMVGELFGKLRKLNKEESVGETEQHSFDEEYDQSELKKTVLEFLDKLRMQSMGPRKDMESVPSSPTDSSVTVLKRIDLDNTEALWVFLKELRSTSQMTFCLDVIFQLILSGEYQPVLYANNQTQFATLMKEVLGCTTDKERSQVKLKINNVLTPVAALQGIVDIGIDKLQNDYSNYFIKQELVTRDMLEYFIAKGASLSEKLQRLLKLHCILSLVTLATSYARINYDDLRQLVPATLKFYESHSHTDIPVFTLSLPAFSTSSSQVKNTCIRQFQPHTWLAAITTANEHITMVQLTAESNSLSSNSYSMATANVHKVCI